MKKKKKSLLSLNKTRIHNLHQLSRIIGGEETNACDTYKDDCRCEETFSCPSSAYAPPTGKGFLDTTLLTPTQTNGLPGNDCC